MSDRNTARWRQAALALALAFAAAAAPTWAQDVNPDSTGREPVITRKALEKARPVTAKHAMVVSAQHLAT
ncbi:MAG: hypothetical protein WBG33_00275, partial [Rhodanobacter sp.]